MSGRLLVAALMATTLAVASASLGARLLVLPAAAQEAKTPLYYQDPDGKPDYSPVPKKTADGRDYVGVFEDNSAPATTPSQPAAKEAGKGRIIYYRNPMGLPDTSPVPKKDSMGMDYIPVYENEAEAGVVTVAPGESSTKATTSSLPSTARPTTADWVTSGCAFNTASTSH